MERVVSFSLLFCLLMTLAACLPDAPIVPPASGSLNNNRIPTSFSRLVPDTVGGVPVVIIGSLTTRQNPSMVTGDEPIDWDFAVAFENRDGKVFEVIQDSLPALLRDSAGTIWSIEGVGLSGPAAGKRLVPANGSLGYWFAFATRYPGLSIDQGPALAIDVPQTIEPEWDVPTQTIVRGAQRDDILSIERPVFVSEAEREQEPFTWSEAERVIGITIGGESRCYPVELLNWHQIVNDEVNGIPVTVTYHILTSTARVWKRNASTPSFGVSGLLYEHNMVPYDRNTISRWVQMENRCVNGARRGEEIEILPFVETTFGTWKRIAPDTRILSTDTGFPYRYNDEPLSGRTSSEEFLTAPISYDDDRLPRKERVFGLIINGEAVVYTQRAFQ